MNAYRSAVERAQSDPEGFWAAEARVLDWSKPFRTVLGSHPGGGARWFGGGELNACHEAVDRHVLEGHGERLALVYDSAMTGTIRRYTYRELQARVAELAGALRRLGVERGDRVLLYVPMIPEAVMAMLACARLGAIHSVVFGGFGSRELGARIDHARPRVILAASCGLEPGRVVVDQEQRHPLAVVRFRVGLDVDVDDVARGAGKDLSRARSKRVGRIGDRRKRLPVDR
jgi:propionyl-CoA synthetase